MHVPIQVQPGESRTARTILSQATGLSKLTVKNAMQEGAVWLRRAVAGEQRLRRAQAVPPAGRIDLPLDGKPAATEYKQLSYHPAVDVSVIDVRMQTGRNDPIRRHLAFIGDPVMDDPFYGENNKNTEGLKLRAEGLEFACPFTKKTLKFELTVDGSF